MFNWFKPRWQHTNESVRLEALSTLEADHEAIMTMAKHDKSQAIRIAACQRIYQLVTVYNLYYAEPAKTVKTAIWQHIQHLWLGNHSQGPSLTQRLQWINEEKFTDIPYLAIVLHAKDSALKTAAFNKINSPADWWEIACTPNDFQQQSIDKFSDIDQLNTLIKTIPAHNKRLLKLAKTHLSHLQNTQQLAATEKALLADYAKLAQQTEAPLNQLSQLDQTWKKHGLENEHQERSEYREQFLAHYQKRQSVIQQQQSLLLQLEDILSQPEKTDLYIDNIQLLIQQENALDSDLKEKLLLQQWQQKIQILNTRLSNQRIQQKQISAWQTLIQQIDKLLLSPNTTPKDLRRIQQNLVNFEIPEGQKSTYQALIHKIDAALAPSTHNLFNQTAFQTLLNTLEQLLLEENLTQAKVIYHDAENLLKSATLSLKDRQKYSQHLQVYLPQIRTVQQRQLDAHEQSLLRLCENAEELAQHPENIANITQALSELRQQWKRSSQQTPSFARRHWQRFDQACKILFDYLQTRRQTIKDERQYYLNEAATLLSQIDAWIAQIDWQAPNWQTLDKFINEWQSRWRRYLQQLSDGERLEYGTPLFLAKDRKHLDQQLQQRFSPVIEKLKQKQLSELQRRENMIHELEQAIKNTDLNQLIPLVKTMQSQWNPVLRMRPRQEEKLWKQFKALCDEVFQRRQSEQLAADEERQQNLQLKENILDKVRHVLHENPNDLISLNETTLQNEWDSIGPVPKERYRSLESEWRTCLQQLIDTQAQFALEKQSLSNNNIQKFNTQLCAIEQQAMAQIPFELPTLPDLDFDEEVKNALLQRITCLDKIMQGDEAARLFLQQHAAISEQHKHELCILKDILYQHPSPPHEQEQRMNLQAQRLKRNLVEGESDDFNWSNLQQEWWKLPAATHEQTLLERFLSKPESK